MFYSKKKKHSFNICNLLRCRVESGATLPLTSCMKTTKYRNVGKNCNSTNAFRPKSLPQGLLRWQCRCLTNTLLFQGSMKTFRLLFSIYALKKISQVHQVRRNYPSSITFSQLWRNSCQLARLFKVKVALSPDLNTARWLAKMDLSASVQKQQGRLSASAVKRELAMPWKWPLAKLLPLSLKSLSDCLILTPPPPLTLNLPILGGNNLAGVRIGHNTDFFDKNVFRVQIALYVEHFFWRWPLSVFFKWTVHIYIYIQCPPLILAPLINMSKGSCENKSALFILLIFHSINSQNSKNK